MLADWETWTVVDDETNPPIYFASTTSFGSTTILEAWYSGGVTQTLTRLTDYYQMNWSQVVVTHDYPTGNFIKASITVNSSSVKAADANIYWAHDSTFICGAHAADFD